MRGPLAALAAVVALAGVSGAVAAPSQAPPGKLLDTLVVQFASPEYVESKITLQRGVAYTLVVSGFGRQTSSHGNVDCDALYCVAGGGQPMSRGVLGFRKDSQAYTKRLSQVAGKTDSDIPYDPGHTYTVKMAADLDFAGKLLVRSEFAHYRGCTAPIICGGLFRVKIYGPAQEENEEDAHSFLFNAWATHPKKIRNPLGKFEAWRIAAFGNRPRYSTIKVSYGEPDWERTSAGRSANVSLLVKKTQLRRSGSAKVLKIDVAVKEQTQFPAFASLPVCAPGSTGTVVLIDDDRLVARGEQKRGQTRDEVHISVPACPYLSHRITNADSLNHDPFVGGRKGKPTGGQWAEVTLGANAAPHDDTTGKPVKTAAQALALVERWIRAASDECEITAWRINVSGLPGLWKISVTVTMAGKSRLAVFSIAGNKLAARNAVAAEILDRCQ